MTDASEVAHRTTRPCAKCGGQKTVRNLGGVWVCSCGKRYAEEPPDAPVLPPATLVPVASSATVDACVVSYEMACGHKTTKSHHDPGAPLYPATTKNVGASYPCRTCGEWQLIVRATFYLAGAR